MPKAILNGVSLHYRLRPGSPMLVLVHGLATSLAFWYLKVFPALRRDLGVLLFDLRGHGQSDMPSTGYTTADMAGDLHALIDHLNIERAHLVGHSYGGAVALHYTVLYPERVHSLTLADARIRCFQPFQRLSDWPQAEKWQKNLEDLDVPTEHDTEMGYRFLEAVAESKRRTVIRKRQLGGIFSPFGLSHGRNRAAEQWLQLLRSTSARNDFQNIAGLTVERIREVRVPMLAIFGEHSHCLLSCEGLLQNLPNCRRVIVPGVGHFHPAVRPRFFACAVHNFILGETWQQRSSEGRPQAVEEVEREQAFLKDGVSGERTSG
jgi:pimeloyl-ACP methyl ester carboxylesterase